MSNHRLELDEEILERTNPRITFSILDQDGAPLMPATLKLTLYDLNTGTLLGGRPAQQNVLGQNGVTVVNGAVTWQTTTADHAIVADGSSIPDERRIAEKHIALFEWSWIDGAVTREDKQEILIRVRPLDKVPAA